MVVIWRFQAERTMIVILLGIILVALLFPGFLRWLLS
jgi:hypothetical protein